jgi:hypothetical protein
MKFIHTYMLAICTMSLIHIAHFSVVHMLVVTVIALFTAFFIHGGEIKAEIEAARDTK